MSLISSAPTALCIAIFILTLSACGKSKQDDSAPAEALPDGPSLESEHAATLTPVPSPSPPPTPTKSNPDVPDVPTDGESGEVPHAESVNGITLKRLALTRAIEDREPINPSEQFESVDKRLYAFIDAKNESDGPATLTVKFRHESGFSAGHVELTIPPNVPRWRTWAYSRAVKRPGDWSVIVENAQGEIVQSKDFSITE